MRIVSRTFEVLDALAAAPDGIGVMKLSAALGESPATIHRLLAVLIDEGMALRDEAKRYHLGAGVLRLATAYQRGNQLVTVAGPHITALSATTRESVFLSELVGEDVICVASAESPRPMTFYMKPGLRTPYHAASSARAILAYQPTERMVALMEREHREAFTRHTPVTTEAALREVDRARKQGFAVCDEEIEIGVTAFSAPISDARGEVRASITIVGPQDRLNGGSRAEFVDALLSTASAISAALGYNQPEAELAAVVEA